MRFQNRDRLTFGMFDSCENNTFIIIVLEWELLPFFDLFFFESRRIIVYCDIRAVSEFYWFEEKFEKTRRSRVFLISEN